MRELLQNFLALAGTVRIEFQEQIWGFWKKISVF